MKITSRNIEWTLSPLAHVFPDEPAFTLSTPIQNGTHTILIERRSRGLADLWVARDACDAGPRTRTIEEAVLGYCELSAYQNRHQIGHSEWMVKIGVPSIEMAAKQIELQIQSYIKGE